MQNNVLCKYKTTIYSEIYFPIGTNYVPTGKQRYHQQSCLQFDYFYCSLIIQKSL